MITERLAAAGMDLLHAVESVVDAARECEACDGTGLQPRTEDDACGICGGTGEYAIVGTIPDLRALIFAVRRVA